VLAGTLRPGPLFKRPIWPISSFFRVIIAENKEIAKRSECEPFGIHRTYGVTLQSRRSHSSSLSRCEPWRRIKKWLWVRLSAMQDHRVCQEDLLHCIPHKTTLRNIRSIISTDFNHYHQELGTFTMPLNSLCSNASGDNTDFPCDIDAITAVSLGIAAGACALIFVIYLLREVRLV
jgi:hypothetical protein